MPSPCHGTPRGSAAPVGKARPGNLPIRSARLSRSARSLIGPTSALTAIGLATQPRAYDMVARPELSDTGRLPAHATTASPTKQQRLGE